MALTDTQQQEAYDLAVKLDGQVSSRNTTAHATIDQLQTDLKPADPPPPPPPPPVDSPVPTSWDRSLDFENGIVFGSGSGQWRNSAGYTITWTTEKGGVEGTGHHAVKITDNGGAHNDDCMCPRMKFEDAGTEYRVGDELWFGGSFWIPSGSRHGTNGNGSRLCDVQAWDSSSNQNCALSALVSPNEKFWVVTYQRGNPTNRVIQLPEQPLIYDRWFSVDVHAKLAESDGAGFTDTYIDGKLVGTRSTKKNKLPGSPAIVGHYQGGGPGFAGSSAGVMWYFDRPRLKRA